MDVGISDSFEILLDTLSHFVHLLNGLVIGNLVKQFLLHKVTNLLWFNILYTMS